MRVSVTFALDMTLCVLALVWPRDIRLAESRSAEAGRAASEMKIKLPEGLAITSPDLLSIATFEGPIYRLDLKTGRTAILRPYFPMAGISDILTDPSGNLIAAIPGACQVVRINLDDSSVQPIVGRGRKIAYGSSGDCGSDGDNGPASKAALEPDSIAQDVNGNLFIVDSWPHAVIRRVDKKSGTITTVVAGSQLQSALSIAVVDNKTLFISQAGKGSRHKGILSMNISSGLLSVLKSSSFGGNKDIWDEKMERRRIFSDPLGNLYLLSESRVFYIDFAKHFVSVVAGAKTKGFSGDGGPATEAQLYWPTSLVLDSAGNIYIADSENQRIRRIDAKTHIITTIAGNGGPPHVPGTIELSQ